MARPGIFGPNREGGQGGLWNPIPDALDDAGDDRLVTQISVPDVTEDPDPPPSAQVRFRARTISVYPKPARSLSAVRRASGIT